MKKVRIISRLDVKGPNVVKGINLEGIRVVGDPNVLSEKYYLDGADELLYVDVVASLYERNNLSHIVERAASNLFIPLTVGGGIRSTEDILTLLRSGADKVSINTSVIKNPNLITEAAEIFGSQCIVLSVEAKKINEGFWEAYIDGGREKTGINVLDWVKKAVDLGAGEILLTSVDKDGTKSGFDLDLLREVSKIVDVPIIASGGCGSINDIIRCLTETSVDAIAIATVLHYNLLSINQIKKELFNKGFPVRL